MKLFDTHTHYDDAKFDALSRKELIKELFDSDIGYILGASVNTQTSLFQCDTAKVFENYYAAVGIHPENCGEYSDIDIAISEIEALASRDKVVAIGEIGLDYYWEENPPREVQKEYFERQLSLAEKIKKPVIVHDREAHGDSLDTVFKYPSVIGVFHSFSGSAEMAAELVKRGWYISFSGVITYKNATRLAEVVKSVPLDRLLVETDCPYLTPVPFRGKVNHSGYVKYTAQKAAELKGISLEELADVTRENGKRLFGISD